MVEKNFKQLIKHNWEDKIGIILFCLSLIVLEIIIVMAFIDPSIMVDDAFTINLITFNPLNLIKYTAFDVHPPLYYLILKGVLELFNTIHIPYNLITLGKCVSIIPIIILLIFSATKIKKEFGWLTAGIFALAITSMPEIAFHSIQLRMYTWVLLFVFLTFYSAYEIIKNPNKRINWIFLVIFGLLSSFTHYYGTICTAIIYIILILWFLISKMEYESKMSNLKKWIVCVFISSVIYLPWVLYVMNNLKQHTSTFWVGPIGFKDVIDYIFFMNGPFSNPYTIPHDILGILMIVAFIILILSSLWFKENNSKNRFISNGFILPILTIIVGIILSILIRPVFIARYLVPCLGVSMLCFAYLLSKNYSKKQIFIPILIIFLLISTVGTCNFINIELNNTHNFEEHNEFMSTISSTDLIIHTRTQTFKTDRYFWENNSNVIIDELQPSNINNTLNSGHNVWLFDSFHNNTDNKELIDNFTKMGYNLQPYKLNYVQQVPFYIYKVTPK